MRVLAPAAILFVLATSEAHAQQQVVTSRPTVTWIGFGRPGDTSGSAGHVDRIGELALEPLRLGLQGEHVPGPTNDPGCTGSSELASVTGGSGFSSQRALGMNLLGGPASSWRTPRLTLFGFSRGGCPLDRAVGGGLTFVVPIRQDIFFVASGGAIYLPSAPDGKGGTGVTTTQARGDIVFTRPGGRSFSVGVSTARGTPGVSFGGVF